MNQAFKVVVDMPGEDNGTFVQLALVGMMINVVSVTPLTAQECLGEDEIEKILKSVDENPYCAKLGLPARRKHYAHALASRIPVGGKKERMKFGEVCRNCGVEKSLQNKDCSYCKPTPPPVGTEHKQGGSDYYVKRITRQVL